MSGRSASGSATERRGGRRAGSLRPFRALVREMQHVPRAERATGVAAEAPERERRGRAEVGRAVEAAGDGEVDARAALAHRPDRERLPGGDVERLPESDRHAVERRLAVGPGECRTRGRTEAKRRAVERDLEHRGALGVAEEAVREARGAVVERPRRGHADVPVAAPSRPGLQRRLGAGPHDVDARGGVLEPREVGGRDPAGDDDRVVAERREPDAVGLGAVQTRLGERRPKPRERLLAGRPVRDQLGDHRVERRRHLDARLHPGLHAEPVDLVREAHVDELAGTRAEVEERVLRVEARLHRVTGRDEPRALGLEIERLARGQAQHPRDQVDAVHRLGDAVLDLQPGVDLEEEEALVGGVDDELDGAGVAVIDLGEQPLGGLGERRPRRVREVRRGALLEHLLVAALRRAVAAADGEHPAPPVAEHLHLDVTGRADVALEVEAGVPEVRAAEPLHAVEGRAQRRLVRAHLHADAAPAGGALEHDRPADGVGGPDRVLHVVEQLAPRQQRHAGARGELAGAVLEPERLDLLGARADEDEALRLAATHERRVLAQEAVARVHRVTALLARDPEQSLRVEVGLRRPAVAELDRPRRRAHVQAVGVDRGVHRHRLDAERVEGADDARRDRAPVGDEHAPERPGPAVVPPAAPPVTAPATVAVVRDVRSRRRRQGAAHTRVSIGVGS